MVEDSCTDLVSATDKSFARRVARLAFERDMVIETCDPNGEVLKFLTALNIDDLELERGLAIVRDSIASLDASHVVEKGGVLSV